MQDLIQLPGALSYCVVFCIICVKDSLRIELSLNNYHHPAINIKGIFLFF